MARKRTNEPTKPDDARAQRSIEALRAGLLKLLEHRPLDQISIKELTDAAGISPPTFFRRFANKEELLEDIAKAEVRLVLNLSAAAIEQQNSKESGAALCAYIHKNRGLWRTLLTGGAAAAMRGEFARASEAIAQTRPRSNPWLPVDLAVPFVTSGIFEILAWWMRQPDDYPMENVVGLFDVLITDAVARPRGVALAVKYPPRKSRAKVQRTARVRAGRVKKH